MPELNVQRSDVRVFAAGADDAVIDALLAGTLARARRLAPCLAGSQLTEDQAAEAKDIIVGIVLRALEEGTGAVTTMIAGPMQQTVDTTKRRAARFRPDEIRDLQALCGITRGGAFSIALSYDETDWGAEYFVPETP